MVSCCGFVLHSCSDSNLFLCLWAISISSLEKGLFLSFAHFRAGASVVHEAATLRWGKPGKPHILSSVALLAHISRSGWIQSISRGQRGGVTGTI